MFVEPSKIMKRLLANVVTTLLVLCAVVVSVVTVRREFVLTRTTLAVPRTSIEKGWSRYADAGHVLGLKNAAVTIIEFADFECPFCQRFTLYMDSLRTLGMSVRVVYRHFPSRNHRFAIQAVRASECAAEEGMFESMHRSLYTYSDSLGIADWWWFAKAAGVQDSVDFQDCVTRTTPIPALARDTADGNRLEVRGTPTLLIQDLRYNGLPTFDSLRAFVERANWKPGE